MTPSDGRSLKEGIPIFIQMRMQTDLEVPVSWLLLPLASYLLWGALAVSWWSESAGLGPSELSVLTNVLAFLGLIASAATSYVVYMLMNRENKHSGRTRALLSSVLRSLLGRVRSSRRLALVPLNSAEDGYYKLLHEERERSAVLWALLFLIPFVGWIFLVTAQWLLSRDLAKHDRLEAVVLEDIDRTLRTAGLQGIPVKNARIHTQDVLGFAVVLVLLSEVSSAFFLGLAGCLVLIYLTVGAFSLLWLDLSIRGPTVHFHYHSELETGMLEALPEDDAGAGNVGVA